MLKKMLVLVLLLPALGGCFHGQRGGRGAHRMPNGHGASITAPAAPAICLR